MKKISINNIFKIIILAVDIFFLPSAFLFHWLSTMMLSRETICLWLRFGLQCATCGGTHFVQSLTKGHFIEAFNHNQYLFILSLFLLFSYILVHFAVFLKSKLAKKMLKFLYNIPALFIHIGILFLFVILRNIPGFIHIAQVLLSL